uniref:Ig-like domain-containing protein n=1 Tax=Pundamilia nyererei TaxID=303518 RepID=A0A3B4FUL2_9CICH
MFRKEHAVNLSFCLCVLTVSQHALAVVVEVYEEAKSVLLPCQYSGIIPEKNPTVMWTRSDLSPTFVHLSENLKKQDDLYCGRTNMSEDLLRTGDLSLTLKYPTERDSGGYICTIYRDKDILRQKVVLQGLQFKPGPQIAVCSLFLSVIILLV